MTDDQITALFHKARAAEYHAVVQGCRDVAPRIDRLRVAHRGSVPKVRARLDSFKRELPLDPTTRFSVLRHFKHSHPP